MTLTVAWFRNRGSMEELVVAADSRLSGGQRWDGCPKILTLPRSDALLSFAGVTDAAYPMMLQLASSIAFYPPSRERRLDVTHLGGHTLRLFNQMRGLINGPFAVGQTDPDPPGALFLLGGYSWRNRAFFTWRFVFENGSFAYRRVVAGRPNEDGWHFCFAGDADAAEHARDRLFALLRAPGRQRVQADGLDMEPFEVLRDVIRDGLFPSVGGPPQLAKIYRHLNTQFFAVEWDGTLTVAGRPVLSYEQAFMPMLDADEPELQPRPPLGAGQALAGETLPGFDEVEED